MEKVLEVKNLVTKFKTDKGEITAVDGVSFDVFKGRTLGIVGESGSGKSVTALSIMKLIPSPPGRVADGEILFRGEDLLKVPGNQMRRIRGNKVSMIFQEPMTSLNPVYTVGEQIEEVVILHQGLRAQEARKKAVELLKLVGIPAPEKRVEEYPHQLSGGMRQRVMIAMALACEPDILIADEPTTALDVTIQAQILDLMRKLQEELGMGIILITHDLGVVAEMCHDVAVMYCGQIIEEAKVEDLFKSPKHPYTKGLLESIPSFDSTKKEERTRLKTIKGMVPSLFELPQGCRFYDRCDYSSTKCSQEKPKFESLSKNHFVSCFSPLEKENS